MSQAKVDRYKEQKANRKQTMKKEKRIRILRNFCMALVCVALIGWVGRAAYVSYDKNKKVEEYKVNYTAIDDFNSALSSMDESGQ